MFHVNDVIIYGTHGVCRIVDIEEKSIGGVKKNYFVLKPVRDQSSAIYAPTDNEHVLKKMRRLLRSEEINDLIDSIPKESSAWITNEAERKELFKSIIKEGDHRKLLNMVQAIYLHKKEREGMGKRLHMVDERFFKEAEQMLYDEFQYVLKLRSKDELMKYISDRIG